MNTRMCVLVPDRSPFPHRARVTEPEVVPRLAPVLVPASLQMVVARVPVLAPASLPLRPRPPLSLFPSLRRDFQPLSLPLSLPPLIRVTAALVCWLRLTACSRWRLRHHRYRHRHCPLRDVSSLRHCPSRVCMHVHGHDRYHWANSMDSRRCDRLGVDPPPRRLRDSPERVRSLRLRAAAAAPSPSTDLPISRSTSRNTRRTIYK